MARVSVLWNRFGQFKAYRQDMRMIYTHSGGREQATVLRLKKIPGRRRRVE
jgi:hypothetical protein